ncbi:MAG: MogA/MoaB family molybdenum cofactor biosynthesis protein [Nakamurella sp.]
MASSDIGATAPRTAAVLIASTRAAAGIYPDKTGPLLAEWLRNKGFDVTGPVVRADGEPFARALVSVIGAQTTGADRPDLVITSGGTGISPTDVTPQVTAGLLDYEIPGLAEALRRRGADAGIATAVLSRGLAGVAGRTLVVNLPGSSGGVKDGMAVLDGVLEHALDQLTGGDHARLDNGAHS